MLRTAFKLLALGTLVAGLAAPAFGASWAVRPHATPKRSLAAAGISQFEADVVAGINDLRRRHGLAPLRMSRSLTQAADGHSHAMLARGFFEHESADGSAFWRRIQRHYTSRGFRYWAVGENLAWQSPDMEPGEAVKLWLNSPPHRRVLLTAKWREVGLAAVQSASAPGVYDGLPVTIVTADFGVRR